jgi:hypothetical protein
MDVRIAARVGLIFTFRAVFVAITLPRQRNTAARLAPEMIVRAHALSAIGWLVRPSFNIQKLLSHEYGNEND